MTDQLGTIFDVNEIGQQRDLLYRPDLRSNQNWVVGNYLTGCGHWGNQDSTMMWLIVQVWSTTKMKLSYCDLPTGYNTWQKPNTTMT